MTLISSLLNFASVSLLLTGCGQPRVAQQSPTTQHTVPNAVQVVESTYSAPGPGPTVKSRVPGGYELKNSQFRVVISDSTGDVTFWGFAGQDRNMVFHRGIYMTLSTMPDASPKGYVEARDDQTWQFLGEDANHIGWRKIYNLEGDHLEVSIMIQNNQPNPVETAIILNGDLPGLRVMHHDPEQFDAVGGYGLVSLHGYNVTHNPSEQPMLPALLQSDRFVLKPQERQSYTTMWMLSQ